MGRGSIRRTLVVGGLTACAAVAALPSTGVAATREYWVAAVPTMWNIVPNGRNAIHGATFPTAETTGETTV